MVNAGLIADQQVYYDSPLKVQSVAYAADHHQQYHPAPASSSYTKTISYSQPAVHSYHSYEPEQHHYVSSYQPEHTVYAASPNHYAHGSSEQNIVRSAHGTVSHISKAVDTPHSSVRKYDTRVINDGYKTLEYAQPAAYHVQPAVHSYAPIAKTVVAQPLITKHLAQPVIAKTVVSQPAHYQYAAQPIQYAAQPLQYSSQYSAPQYAATQYAAHAPVLASKVHYSPAIEVAHASFESPVAHYSW